jgi:hypothetical protein
MVAAWIIMVINVGLAIFHVQRDGFSVLVLLSLARIVLHTTVVAALLLALRRVRDTMALYKEESAYLKEWLLTDLRKRNQTSADPSDEQPWS